MFDDGTLLRANQAYELIPSDRLSSEDRQRIVDRDVTGEHLYGVLRPRAGARLDVRLVDPDTALLFLTLRTPGPLPRYLRARSGAEMTATLHRLILDGVLEVHDGHRYVTGPAATTAMAPLDATGGQGRIAALSLTALRYGQALADLDESSLAQRLYAFGRRPITPDLRQGFAHELAVSRLLGIDASPVADALTQRWAAAPLGPDATPGWRLWRARSTSGRPADPSDARFKLYVSPDLDDLRAAVAAVAVDLAGVPGIRGFKVGRLITDLCRPDKLVVYFGRFDDLQAAAVRLSDRLAGCHAHGVPFTAQVTRDGLLSWGIDTPADTPGLGGTSWRVRLTRHLAESLTVCRAVPLVGAEPWQYAVQRLAATGVDVDNWAPVGQIRARAATTIGGPV